jgi:hypothetical protein
MADAPQMGRPSKYDPAFCERVEDFMAQGFSRMAAAGEIGVCYDTLTNWMAVHPEFFQAVKRGQAKRTIFLERGLLAAETGPQVTSRIFALKNAAPDEWKDKTESEITHKFADMADEELEAEIARLSSGQ